MCDIIDSEYDALIVSGASSNYIRSDIFNPTCDSVECFVEQNQIICLANTSTTNRVKATYSVRIFKTP